MTDREIDFVDDDDDPDGHDEDLAQPGTRAWRARADEFLRGKYGAPTVVVVLVLAFLVGRALLHERPDGAPPPTTSTSATAATTSEPTPAPSGSSVTIDAGTGQVVTVPRRTGPDPTRCPGLRCYTSASVPDSVRDAIRAVFPKARFRAVETIRLVDHAAVDPLWYREVVAVVGPAVLIVRVQARSAGDVARGGARDDGAHTQSFLDTPQQQWFVRTQLNDVSGRDDVFDRLETLVADPRLLTT